MADRGSTSLPASKPARRCAAAATTCAPAPSCSCRARSSPLRSAGCWPASTAAPSPSPDGFGWRCSPPVTSWSPTAHHSARPDPREQPTMLVAPRRRGRLRGGRPRRGRRRRGALEAALRDAAASCDAIVTSGGVSMGDYDVVKAVLSTDRRHALDADRDPAGQAVRVRAAEPATADRSRCSACPVTRSARWSASSCSPARRCVR